MDRNKPFMLKPAAKDYLWGGSRLNDDFNMGLMTSPLAEVWMYSTHPDGESKLENGELLSEVYSGRFCFVGVQADCRCAKDLV